MTNQQAEVDIDFSSLPQVDQTARAPVQPRPRFDGDVSELPDCACWALCLSCQLVPRLPVEPHDVPLDGVASPDRTIRGVGRSSGVRGASDQHPVG